MMRRKVGWVDKASLFAINAGKSLKAEYLLEPLATIQQRYCLITIGGRVWVLDMRKLETRTSEGRASALELSSRTDGSLMIMRALEAQFPAADSLEYSKKVLCQSQHHLL